RRHADAGRRLWLCADTGAGGADRVHDEAVGLCCARRPHGLCAPAVLVAGECRGSADAYSGPARMRRFPQIALLPDGKRLHLQDGPIDLVMEAKGSAAAVRAAYEAAAHRFTGLL